MNVLIAGGGTAGHVFPAIALADALVRDHAATVRFVGAPQGQEATLVPAAGYPFTAVAAEQMPRKLSAATFTAPFTALGSIRRCRPLVKAADVVVGVGGFASMPAVLAAMSARRPLVLHEQNAIPGIANRLAARWARTVALSFADAAARLPRATRTVLTGNPVRQFVLEVPAHRDGLAKEAYVELGLDPERRTVLVLGGSQGALALDTVVAEAAPRLAHRSDLQLVVLTGRGHLRTIEASAGKFGHLRVVAREFLQRIDLAYAVADLAIARAGSGNLAELAVCGVPSILVPYPYATENHQEANARECERAGGAIVVLQSDLTPERFVGSVTTLLDDPDSLARMRERASAWGRPDAAARLADLVAASVAAPDGPRAG